MEIKPAYSVEKQIEKLKSRSLIFRDEEQAKNILSTVNYYLLAGYFHGFKNKKTGKYNKGLVFEDVYSIYKFDCGLRNILLFAIDRIEQLVRTRIAYSLAMEYKDDSCMYEAATFFKDEKEHKRFIGLFNKSVKNNKNLPFVKHHKDNYDGHFPIWVAVELFTLGNLEALFQNIDSKNRKKISSTFDVRPDVFDSWLTNLRVTRNMVAHGSRLYKSNILHIPKISQKYSYQISNNKIFSQIYLLRILYPDETDWQRIVDDLDTLVKSYGMVVKLDEIGFPENWEEILRSSFLKYQ